MEKSFRQIEADIQEKGFKALFEEAAFDLQNFTRTVSYLLEREETTEDMKKELNTLTGKAIGLGVGILNFAENKLNEY